MGFDNEHGRPAGSARNTARLWAALGLTFVYMIAEAVGGWYANSLALLADAGHMLTDVAALSLTLAAFWFAGRPATPRKTYGYYRLEILAAFINGVALALLSIWIIFEAIARWQAPPAVFGLQMTVIAFGGLIVNVVAVMLLRVERGANLNLHGAWLHVMGDLLGSVAAIIAGVLIIAFGWMWADPVTSILISLIIIFGAWRLILDSVNILLEGTPPHIDAAAVESTILSLEGVCGVHDLHIWTISSGMEALSAHLTHDSAVPHPRLLASVRARLKADFGIEHMTIQMETPKLEAEAVYVCETGTKCFEPTANAKVQHGRGN